MQGNKFRYPVLSIFLVIVVAGCNIINPDEPVPSYIYIDKFSFTCSLDDQGYNSEKITDGWVYANNAFIGAFELPATVPLLTDSTTEIIVYPGIKENGISGTAMIYPFYNAYTVTRDLTAGETDTLHPATTYKPSTAISFLFVERFEVGNIFGPVESDVTLTTTTSETDVFEGDRSAVTTLTPDLDTFRVATGTPLYLPTIDHQLFLEIDYKCAIEYQVFMKCTTTTGSQLYDDVLTITPKEYWNKIYVNLNPSLQFFAAFQPDYYALEFRAQNISGDTAQLFYDNIKLIQSK